MIQLRYWLKATRPKTLPASLIPVFIGTSVAYSENKFDFFLFIITALCSMLIQIITNYLNELYDFKKGADTKERLGPQRIVADGIVKPRQMAIVSILLIIITISLGMILVAHAGIIILISGLVSILMAYAYTGGPYPLAYKGVGDLFVLVFFGLLATAGTHYVQTLNFSYIALIAGFAPGFFSMNILGVNNIRDINTDIKVGKMTLQARLGVNKSKIMYYIINLLAFLVPIVLFLFNMNMILLLPILIFPISISICRKLSKSTGAEYNIILNNTGKLLVFYGILQSISFVLINI